MVDGGSRRVARVRDVLRALAGRIATGSPPISTSRARGVPRLRGNATREHEDPRPHRLTALADGGHSAVDELRRGAAPGSDATKGARCARPVRYAVIASGVVEPGVHDDVGDVDVLQAGGFGAAPQQRRGVRSRLGARLQLRRTSRAGRYPKSRATSSTTSFDARARGLTEHRRDHPAAGSHHAAHLRQRALRVRRCARSRTRSPQRRIRRRRRAARTCRRRPRATAASPIRPSMSGDMSTAIGTAPPSRSARHSAPVPAPTSSTVAPRKLARDARDRDRRQLVVHARPAPEPTRLRRPGRRCWVRWSRIPCREALAPPSELGRVAGLGPAQLQEGSGQCGRELRVPPRRGVDARGLERVSVRVDGVLLDLGKPVAVDRQVPREIDERRSLAGAIPVEQDGPRASRPRLPSFQSPWMSVCGPRLQGGDQRPRIVGELAKPARVRGILLVEPPPSALRPRGDRDPRAASPLRARPWPGSGRRSDGHSGNRPAVIAESPVRGVQRRHVLDEPRCSVMEIGSLPAGISAVGDVAHQERDAPDVRRPSVNGRTADDRVVDGRRERVEHAGRRAASAGASRGRRSRA